MGGAASVLKVFFQSWTDSLARFWLAFDGFVTGASTVMTTLNSAAPVWGTTVITWVVQWIPVPIRLLLVFLVGTWLVGMLEGVIHWASLGVYHPSFVNSMGKKVGGWWTRGG